MHTTLLKYFEMIHIRVTMLLPVTAHTKAGGEWVCCWVEYPNRPVRYQRNGAVLPFISSYTRVTS